MIGSSANPVVAGMRQPPSEGEPFLAMSSFFTRAARLLCLPATLAGLLLATAQVEAQQPRVAERMRPAFPALSFQAGQWAGADAVNRLNGQLPAIAAWYGKTSDQLRAEFLADRRLRIDGRGRLFVVDELTTPLHGTTAPTVQKGVMDGNLEDLANTFKLHSRPGANLTIYLDFDGATITGTAWNSSASTITAVPFDIDNVVSTNFSNAELQRIQYIWQHVAEDYAPFDVDVTTEPPSYDQLHRNDGNDTQFGTTVVITKTTGVYNCSCGGVAYVGVFNMSGADSETYKPALVFYDKLGPGDEKYVAEAISHEAGHNMGLSHDGVTGGAAYYSGQGTDAVTGWAPIMGVGYYKPLVQFSKGEYTSANNREDDFAVAQSYGLALRPDDYGNTNATASSFSGSTSGGVTSGSMDGVVETAADVDVFAINASAGSFSASVAPASRSPNADLVITLFNSAGSVLATSNPLNALNGTISYSLPATGTYYIQIKGTGQGSASSTGYSSYGSVGNYRVTASYPAAVEGAPNAVLTATPETGVAPLNVALNGSGSTDSDGIQYYYWDFGNGTDTVSNVSSTNRTYTTAGTYVAKLTVVDTKGVSSTASKTITVTAPVVQKTASVPTIQMSLKISNTKYGTATAVISVVDQAGKALPRATVNATWSGVVSRSFTATTGTAGTVTNTSPSTRSLGCFKLTVTKITMSGYTFNQSPLPSNQVCRTN